MISSYNVTGNDIPPTSYITLKVRPATTRKLLKNTYRSL